MNKELSIEHKDLSAPDEEKDKSAFVNVGIEVNDELRIRAIRPSMTLLEFLREELNLTGTKKGCDLGDCGCCTVLVDQKPVLSCLMLAADAEGSKVTTIEAVAQNGELHPIQKAMVEQGGIQCGYCTPAMVMTGVHMMEENPTADNAEIKEAISGTICRCTGYTKIEKAFEVALKDGGKS